MGVGTSFVRAGRSVAIAHARGTVKEFRWTNPHVFIQVFDISEINVAGDDFDTSILIKYKPEAARLLDATTGHDGLKLAFVVDDDVWLAFTWQGPDGMGPAGTQLSLRHGMAKAKKLMESIRSCTDTQPR